jgi:hypothetical protein
MFSKRHARKHFQSINQREIIDNCEKIIEILFPICQQTKKTKKILIKKQKQIFLCSQQINNENRERQKSLEIQNAPS